MIRTVQQRNNHILRLRGILPQLPSLIPNDIAECLTLEEYQIIGKISKKLMHKMDEVATKNAIKRILKTKSLTKQAQKDIRTIKGCWIEDEDMQELWEGIKNEYTP